MPTMQLEDVFGNPNEHTTHWGISRKSPKGQLNRLQFADASGVGRREWDLSELTLDTIRARWGAGEYRVHWLSEDENDPQAGRKGVGQSPFFTLHPTTAEKPAPEPPAGPVDPQLAALQFAERMISLSDARAAAQVDSLARLAGLGQAAPVATVPAASSEGSDVVATLKAAIAGLEAKFDAERKQREIEDKHREAIAAKEREIAELKQQIRERDRDDEVPAVQPSEDAGIMGQAMAGIVNAAVANPKAAIEVIGPLLAPLLAPIVAKALAAQQQPAPHPHTITVPAQPPPPPVRATAPSPSPVPSEPAPVSVNSVMPQQPIGQVPVVSPNGSAVTP